MAHELTQLVQQSGKAYAPQAKLIVSTTGDTGEREADSVAEQVFAGTSSAVHYCAPATGLQRLTAQELLDARESTRVNGIAAHAAIQADFVSQKGQDAFPITSIEGASFSHFDLSCGDVPSPTSIRPVPLGGAAGTGYPDLVLRASDNDVELAEIKPAHYTCIPEAESQVNNYKVKGNRLRKWRQEQGIGTFRLMPSSSYMPTTPTPVGTEPVSVAWYGPGVLLSKAVREQDPDIFVCGTSDQGLIDKFLGNVLDRAQGVVDNYINQAIDAVVTKAINTVSIRQAINLLYKYAREELLKEMGIIAKLPAGLADEIIVDMIAQAIEAQLKGVTEQSLRNMVMTVKDRILNNLRERLKAQLRSCLQESLTALCALAAEGLVTITAAELLKKLRENMPQYLVPALIAAIEEVVGEILIELGTEVGKALLIALGAVAAVALFILLLPEEGIGGIIAGIIRLALALIEWLPTLLPELPLIFQFALNDQSQNDDGGVAIADEGSMQEEDTTTEEALA